MTKKLNHDEIARGIVLASGMRYSFKSIAQATGYSERQVKRDVHAGAFAPDDLISLSRYIQASPKGKEPEAKYAVPASQFPAQPLPK